MSTQIVRQISCFNYDILKMQLTGLQNIILLNEYACAYKIVKLYLVINGVWTGNDYVEIVLRKEK